MALETETIIQLTTGIVNQVKVLVGGLFGLYLIYFLYMMYKKTQEAKTLKRILAELRVLNENFEEWRQHNMISRISSAKTMPRKSRK